ncbi:glycosyltransferase family 2 protein [Leyella stercorea]|uniref:glycosyltransferase family 2 protein n=1 Tax=Leyella stercorea TaxID=363265 RepID=UPI003F7E3CE1
MKVSIVTPVYNAEAFLRKTIESVIKQTYSNFELLLVDDGSTDESGLIVDEYSKKDKRIVAIHQNNSGVSSARNTALKNATGEWVCFLDSDDEVTPTWLDSYVAAIDERTDIIFQGAHILTNQGDVEYKLDNHFYHRHDIYKVIELWQHQKLDMGSAWSKMIRMSVIEKNNLSFNSQISYYEDWVFLTNVICHSKAFKTINATNYIYNRKNSQLTSSGRATFSAKRRIKLLMVRYEAAISLRRINQKAYDIYMESVTRLLMQTIYKIYQERFPVLECFNLLNIFKSYQINKATLNAKERLIDLLWIRKSNNLSNILLSIFRL